jgi:hypothetical protein
LRADEEMTGGIIHKPMFERLVLCEYAVGDLTTANANVFYELGVRHAVRQWSTVLLFAEGGNQLPFDVAPLRAMPYPLAADGTPANVAAVRQALVARLHEARQAAPTARCSSCSRTSPRSTTPRPTCSGIACATRPRSKERLAKARKAGLDAVRAVHAQLGDIANAEAGVVVDLFLSYRAVKAWAT